jgi:DUF1680 family protein
MLIFRDEYSRYYDSNRNVKYNYVQLLDTNEISQHTPNFKKPKVTLETTGKNGHKTAIKQLVTLYIQTGNKAYLEASQSFFNDVFVQPAEEENKQAIWSMYNGMLSRYAESYAGNLNPEIANRIKDLI